MDRFYQTLENMGYLHPVHPPFTHILIGAVILAFIFGLTALIFRHHPLAVTARHCIILAFIFIFPTMLLGYMDWQHYYGGEWIFPIRMKIVLASVLTVLLFVVLLLHGKRRLAPMLTLLMYTLCFFSVAALGYFGGAIVFGTPPRQAGVAREETQNGKSTEKVTFADISEIFHQNCNRCHMGEKPSVGLRLDNYESVIAGSEGGPVVIPGNPGESELVLRITGKAKPAMPLGQSLLPESTIQTIVRWIEQGSPKDDAA